MHEYPPGSPLYPRSSYVHDVKRRLPSDAFEPARSRIAFLPAHVAIIVGASLAIARGWVPWPVVPVLSLVIGACFAGLMFVGHETLHGGIVRGKRLQYAIGLLGFAPFFLSPRMWIAWHNQTHHANTNRENDPDGYATLERYQARRSTRFSVDAFSLGGKRWRGALSLILGFTVQSVDQLFSARENGFLDRRASRWAFAESVTFVVAWGVVAAFVGFVPFLFMFVLPVLIGNACVMAFILTNHSLSPKVSIDDPLVSGLSVTTPRLLQWLSLGFGFHVEHHLFPAMSTRHAPAVRDLLVEHWPERYQSMPLGDALRRLHATARVYKDAKTLYDPQTGAEFDTLLPRS
jgi:fatty acid desaturase